MFKKIINKLFPKKYDFIKDIIIPRYFRKRIKCPFYGFDTTFHNSNCHECALGGDCHLIKFDDPKVVKFDTDPINNCVKLKHVNSYNLTTTSLDISNLSTTTKLNLKVFPNEYRPLDVDNWKGIPFHVWKSISINPYRTMLIWFIIEKHKIIKRNIGIDYIDKEDIDELMLLEDSRCEHILKYMFKQNIYGSFSDSQICPWCNINISCCDCNYGNRHGICTTHNKGRYSKIIKKISSISSLDAINGLVIIMRSRYNRLSENIVEL